MERITREFPMAETVSELDILLEHLALMDSADFTYCRMRHERLVIDANGQPKKLHGNFLPPVCNDKIIEMRPACAHHNKSDRPMAATVLYNLHTITHPSGQDRIEKIQQENQAARNNLRMADDRRGSLSTMIAQRLQSQPYWKLQDDKKLADADRDIDRIYDEVFAKIQKIHTEIRILIVQAICELSGLPQELQPAL